MIVNRSWRTICAIIKIAVRSARENKIDLSTEINKTFCRKVAYTTTTTTTTTNVGTVSHSVCHDDTEKFGRMTC